MGELKSSCKSLSLKRKAQPKHVRKYFDEEGLHVIVFNLDGSIFEHWLIPKEKVTNEDVARATMGVCDG